MSVATDARVELVAPVGAVREGSGDGWTLLVDLPAERLRSALAWALHAAPANRDAVPGTTVCDVLVELGPADRHAGGLDRGWHTGAGLPGAGGWAVTVVATDRYRMAWSTLSVHADRPADQVEGAGVQPDKRLPVLLGVAAARQLLAGIPKSARTVALAVPLTRKGDVDGGTWVELRHAGGTVHVDQSTADPAWLPWRKFTSRKARKGDVDAWKACFMGDACKAATVAAGRDATLQALPGGEVPTLLRVTGATSALDGAAYSAVLMPVRLPS